MKFAPTRQVNDWVDQLITRIEVVAPQEFNRQYLYRPIDSARQIAWEFDKTALSVKEFFFTPTEQLVVFEMSGSEVFLHEIHNTRDRILFGIRPCDARGLVVLDAMFLETEPVDPHYRDHRQRNLLVGLACAEMGETCFCTSMGGSPDDTTGMDIMLTAVDGGFLVDVLTERGAGIAASLESVETDQLPTHPKRTPEIKTPRQDQWEKLFQNPIWEDTAERCLSCRICAYLCPTCRCFDVRDEQLPSENGAQKFERIRIWDSCASEAYRKIAGGHNPRAAKAERLRNRMFCKYHYYPAQYGPMACTGCGRCIEHCPVNIDIVETLQTLAEVNP